MSCPADLTAPLDAMRVHDGQIVAEIADALLWYAPGADKAQAEVTAHTILPISHDLLMATCRRDEACAAMLPKNLRVCLDAPATRLQPE